jgi:hypothetical protein
MQRARRDDNRGKGERREFQFGKGGRATLTHPFFVSIEASSIKITIKVRRLALIADRVVFLEKARNGTPLTR